MGSQTEKHMVNPYAKTRPPDDPHFTFTLGDWTWKVLKIYKPPRATLADQYSRALCRVVTPMTGDLGDLGDAYCRDIPGLLEELLRVDTAQQQRVPK
jgi:hypothetical protein